jgi:ATP-dependent Clp protease adapter protein ClpS
MNSQKQISLKEFQRHQLMESELNDILDKHGITFSEEFNLILHNDNINDMIHVVVSLYQVCKLSNERSLSVMLEAHTKGRSVIRNGNLDELHYMRLGMENKNLSVTIEHAD